MSLKKAGVYRVVAALDILDTDNRERMHRKSHIVQIHIPDIILVVIVIEVPDQRVDRIIEKSGSIVELKVQGEPLYAGKVNLGKSLLFVLVVLIQLSVKRVGPSGSVDPADHFIEPIESALIAAISESRREESSG